MRHTFQKFSLFVIAAAIICPPLLEARNAGRIAGRVKGKEGEALIGAVIAIFKEDKAGGTISFTRTDNRGSYSLSNLAPGAYFLQVTSEGYQALTTRNIKVDSGRTTAMDVILQEFLGYISNDGDPRNWDVRTVMRSSSDRRLIFRDLPGISVPESADEFCRSGVINFASSAGLGGENYSVYPSQGKNGVISNFVYTEPISQHGRMIFSGQLNSGYDSYWRVRNTYNYRPDPSRDLKFSVGYGRMNLSSSNLNSVSRPAQFFTEDPALRESGIQSVALGFGATNKIFDTMALEYGFDVSRLYYGSTKSFFSPYFQVVVTPSGTWVFKAAVASKRLSENNSVVLPDGEVVNLMEPTYIANINGEVNLSQFKHKEISAGRTLTEVTSVEVAVYEDRINGPGLPFVVNEVTAGQSSSTLTQLTGDQAAQHGMRVSVNRKLSDFLDGTVTYVYGTGSSVGRVENALTNEVLAKNLLKYIQRSYYNSITGQLSADFPRTKTLLTTIVRWYPGSPLTPLDLFADRMDVMTKGINFRLRQAIPVPEFMGSAGRWEALIDVRNLFDQGGAIIHTADGTVSLTRNPRSLRFGLNLNFY